MYNVTSDYPIEIRFVKIQERVLNLKNLDHSKSDYSIGSGN